jgi:hypothetical protein
VPILFDIQRTIGVGVLQLHPPNSTAASDTYKLATLACQGTLRSPAEHRNLIRASPASVWSLLPYRCRLSLAGGCRLRGSLLRWAGMVATDSSATIRVQQVPDQHKRVITT